MAGDLMTAAQNEAGRLLREQREFLLALEPQEGLLHSREADGKKRVLDKERVAEIVEVLDGEADKITRLEITLAVAGTAKAGKSTAVNAIVGTKVLPIRNTPMTALPTVIRHEPNLREPRLTVNNASALDDMAREIAQKLQNGHRLEEVRKAYDVDMKALIDDLAAGRLPAIGERHLGRDRVFEALRSINDLLRLGRHDAVGVELPMEEYDELHEMPSLDVHFCCLADATPATGALALLDLPGFNEAGMSKRLKMVLKEQLEKASAVLVILDYTQLNTEASGELETLIDAVSGMMADRIFVLINKFDQRTADDAYSDEGDLRNHIATYTMKGRVDPRHVYPVSAQRAYLASRALEDLVRRGRLPSPSEEKWVFDFAKEAFSSRDRETGPSDPNRARKEAKALWSDSKFDAPLKDVVVAAQNQAATLALQSALGKLKDYGDDIENHLNLSIGSLAADIKKLQNIILEMENSINSIEESKNRFKSLAKEAKHEIMSKIRKELAVVKTRIKNDIEKEFEKQLQGLSEQLKNKLTENNRGFTLHNLPGIRRKLVHQEKVEYVERLIGELRQKGEFEYENEDKYEDVKEIISGVCSNIAEQFVCDAISSVQTVADSEIERMENGLKNLLGETRSKARCALEDTGIEVNLSVPDVELDRKAVKASNVRLSGSKRTRQGRPYTIITNDFLNFIDIGDWFGFGKVEFHSLEEYYVINRGQMIQILQRGLARTSEELSRYVTDMIETWKAECDRRFDGERDVLERYNQILMDGICQRENDHELANRIVVSARQLQKGFEHDRAMVRAFEEAVEEL